MFVFDHNQIGLNLAAKTEKSSIPIQVYSISAIYTKVTEVTGSTGIR